MVAYFRYQLSPNWPGCLAVIIPDIFDLYNSVRCPQLQHIQFALALK